ncbi:MAG: hypothetical protein RLN70_12100, partial [Rhodospirillaceae bacterium]
GRASAMRLSVLSNTMCPRDVRPTVFVSAFAGAAALMLATPALAEESRSFVVSWFAQATNTTEGDCSRGAHPALEEVYFMYLPHLGIPQEDIEEIRQAFLEGRDHEGLRDLMMVRGRINGEPTNPWTHPASVEDLNLPGVDGKYAYGFDLDGLGADDPNGFEHPERDVKGIDHQLYRALGCARSFRGTLEEGPTYWAWAWGQLVSSQPAWVVTISADDLSVDGPVTVRLERALEHLRVNGDSSPRANMAYRIDPDPRSRNEFQGQINDGVVTVDGGGDLRLFQNPLVAPELVLRNFHFRMEIDDDGKSMRAIMGGYQPWEDVYWGFGNLSVGGEQQVIGDAAQFYHLMKRYADADPDPVTGQNMSISAAYYIEGVPAFADLPASVQTAASAAQD